VGVVLFLVSQRGQTLMPLLWLLHAERTTLFDTSFQTLLPRFPSFLPVEASGQPCRTRGDHGARDGPRPGPVRSGHQLNRAGQ
jgi:hypothetical protein